MKGVKVKYLIEELQEHDPNARCMVYLGGKVGFVGLYLDGRGDDPNDPVEFSLSDWNFNSGKSKNERDKNERG